MEGKRTYGTTKPVPLAKARSVSSLRAKGDADSGKTLLNKNSPSVLRASSSTLHTSAVKSAGKDSRYKVTVNSEMNGEALAEEQKDDMVDDAYNTYLRTISMTVLLEKSKHKMRGDVDKQISTLQKRVNDTLDALEETKSRLNAVCLLQEQNDLLTHFNDACVSYSNEPAFTKGKSFQELLTDISRLNNQLPCKNVSIPATSTELTQFQDATSKLLRTLESISTTYGSDQLPITMTAAELEKIKSTQDTVEIMKKSTNVVSHKASTNILNEAVMKISQLEINK